MSVLIMDDMMLLDDEPSPTLENVLSGFTWCAPLVVSVLKICGVTL